MADAVLWEGALWPTGGLEAARWQAEQVRELGSQVLRVLDWELPAKAKRQISLVVDTSGSSWGRGARDVATRIVSNLVDVLDAGDRLELWTMGRDKAEYEAVSSGPASRAALKNAIVSRMGQPFRGGTWLRPTLQALKVQEVERQGTALARLLVVVTDGEVFDIPWEDHSLWPASSTLLLLPDELIGAEDAFGPAERTKVAGWSYGKIGEWLAPVTQPERVELGWRGVKLWAISDGSGKFVTLNEIGSVIVPPAGDRRVHVALLGGSRPDPRLIHGPTTTIARVDARPFEYAGPRERDLLRAIRERAIGLLLLWNPEALTSLASRGPRARLVCSPCGETANASGLRSLFCERCGALLVAYGRALREDPIPDFPCFSLEAGVPVRPLALAGAALSRAQAKLDLPFVSFDDSTLGGQVLLVAP